MATLTLSTEELIALKVGLESELEELNELANKATRKFELQIWNGQIYTRTTILGKINRALGDDQ